MPWKTVCCPKCGNTVRVFIVDGAVGWRCLKCRTFHRLEVLNSQQTLDNFEEGECYEQDLVREEEEDGFRCGVRPIVVRGLGGKRRKVFWTKW